VSSGFEPSSSATLPEELAPIGSFRRIDEGNSFKKDVLPESSYGTF
jgi:hypothetical protein